VGLHVVSADCHALLGADGPSPPDTGRSGLGVVIRIAAPAISPSALPAAADCVVLNVVFIA
jgi:hypothetical protein